MTWEMKHGPNLEWYMDLVDEEGIVPLALMDRPDLDDDLVPVWRAFQMLSPSRSIGFGTVGAIPLSEIKSYLDMFGPQQPDEREDFLYLLSELDHEFLRVRNADRPKHQGGQHGGQAGGG